MIDFSHIPNGTTADIQEFTASASSWQTWRKPRGVSLINILCIGGGGGGGGGFVTSANASRGGGGGGASSS